MKGIICYYSGSGNTKLACEYIANKIGSIEFEFCDITKDSIPDFNQYELAGFATFTDSWGPSKICKDFIEKIPNVKEKLAFIFNTYGVLSMGTQKALYKMVSGKGFNVINGHALHTPESFPPAIVFGRGFEDSPNDDELNKFNSFIEWLETQINNYISGKEIEIVKINFGGLSSMFSSMPKFKRHFMMGNKKVDGERCIECGTCEKVCNYQAIQCNPKPVFDEKKCNVCWACYNHCPTRAIYTKKYKDKGHYPKPINKLREKLTV
jgi:ferredoxin/flavodoxin